MNNQEIEMEHINPPNEEIQPQISYFHQPHPGQVAPENLRIHQHSPRNNQVVPVNNDLTEPQLKKLEFKLPAISEEHKKSLEGQQIPIPVETPNFELVISKNEDEQYYGEVIKLKTTQQEQFINGYQRNGSRQFGQKQDLIFHGQGYYISQNEYYHGQFFFGEFHGKGTFLRFEQQSQENQKIQKYFLGEQYDNIFKIVKAQEIQEDGNNSGKYIWYDNNQNQNQRRDGKYIWKDGSKYTGNFQNKEMHGNGIMEFLNGNIYTGQWQRKFMHGFGEYLWANGDQYTGFYKDGQRHGFGHYKWANGIEYIGFYEDGLQHGEGWLKSKKHRPRLHNWRQGAIYNEEEIPKQE